MKIIINEDEFTKNELDSWKRKRVGKVLKNLKVTLPIVKDTDELCDRLTLIKLKMSYEEITSSMMLKLIIGQVGMKAATILSGNKRRTAITTIFADGITAEKFNIIIDSLMLEDSLEYRKVNLATCPDQKQQEIHLFLPSFSLLLMMRRD